MNQHNFHQAVLEADASRRQALLDASAETLAPYLHDDFVQIHATGVLDSRASLLAKVAGGALVYQSIEVPQSVVHLLADGVALQVSEVLQTVVIAGAPKLVHVRVAAVWLQVEGAWRLRSYQGSTMAAPTPGR